MGIDRGDQPIVRFAPPLIGDEEMRAVIEVLESDWITTGPKVSLFEEQFRNFLGAPAALALNSCTAGLHLALCVLGVETGDEVITSTLTFASTVNVIEHVGARPLLVDVEPDTLNLDPKCVERSITPRTKAIIAVHYAGHPADMGALRFLAERHDLAIVEDAAHALPAASQGQRVGASANLTAFSFYATKNLTTAEGGMLTGEPHFVERARTLSLHGMSRNAWNRYDAAGSWRYDVVAPGFKYNMTDIQAAIGLAQLARLDAMQRRRAAIFARYNEAFENLPELQLPASRPGVQSAQHLYVLRLRDGAPAGKRDALIAALKDRGICTSVHFIPVHLHTFYREKYGFRPGDFPIAWDNFQRMLSLPLSPALSDEEVGRVIDAMIDAVRAPRTRSAA